METVNKDPDGAPEPSAFSENREAKNRVSTKDDDKDEASKNQPQEEHVDETEKTTPQEIISLQRDLSALVNNTYTAFIAKELLRRSKLEEAHKIRMEQVENDAKSSRAILEEIRSRWSNEGIPQELQKALNSQQQLCNDVIEDKKKLINDLQQELKARDDRFVKELRKQAEELDLTIERMEEQINTLTKAYREELSQMESVYMLKREALLTRDKTDWEEHMRDLCRKELERVTQWKEKVEEYETIIHNLMLDSIEKRNNAEIEHNAKFQVLERDHQNLKGSSMLTKLKNIRAKNQVDVRKFNLTDMKKRATSLQIEIKNIVSKCINEKKQLAKKSQYLSESYKHDIQQYEHMQKKIKHFSAANARKFKDMWLMLDAEIKKLAERALDIDLQICKHLGLSWEPPPLAFMVHCDPNQAASQPFQTGGALHCSQESMGTNGDGRSIKMYKKVTAVQCEDGAEVEGGKLPMETLRKVMKMLCNEVGYLMEDKQLKLLAPLEEEEQAVVKPCSLISSLGIEEDDLPKLAHFLLEYQRQQTEGDCGKLGASSDLEEAAGTSSTTNLTSDLINYNHVLPALKHFLEQHVKTRESSDHQKSTLLHFEAWDSSEKAAYWDRMGNIIPEDKVRLWEAAENTLKQYLEVLTDISDLIPETETLKQQNNELRMLLQQSLNLSVSTEMETS
ncbi:dynein regulatory complex protein 1 [Channa argus]